MRVFYICSTTSGGPSPTSARLSTSRCDARRGRCHVRAHACARAACAAPRAPSPRRGDTRGALRRRGPWVSLAVGVPGRGCPRSWVCLAVGVPGRGCAWPLVVRRGPWVSSLRAEAAAVTRGGAAGQQPRDVELRRPLREQPRQVRPCHPSRASDVTRASNVSVRAGLGRSAPPAPRRTLLHPSAVVFESLLACLRVSVNRTGCER
jgi:hypothetical protein